MSTDSTIKLKKSSVPAKVPQANDLDFGELAINFADGKLYFKDSNSDIDYFYSPSFTKISINGEDDFVALSPESELNINSNDYITFSTDVSTNTVTIETNHAVADSSETLVARGSDNEFGISRIDFTIPTEEFPDPAAGQMQWNLDDGTLDLGLNGTDVILQLGQETLYRVQNNTGSTIPNGTLCMFAGTLGQSSRLLVAPWDGDSPSQFIMGIATEDILDDSDGFVTHFGKVRGIDTTGAPYSESWSNGDILYAGPSGGLTKVKPDAPNVKTIVAVVINAHPSVGVLFVRPTFSSNLDDDDLVELDNLQNNDLLVYNAATTRFENANASDIFSIPVNLNQNSDFGNVFDSVVESQDLGFVFNPQISSFNWGQIVLSGLLYPDQLVLPTFTINTLPNPNIPAQLVYVSDETGGPIVAFSDGQDWRRLNDRQIVE